LKLTARLPKDEPDGLTDEGSVEELLLPPGLSPDAVQPLRGGRTVQMAGATMGTGWSLTAVVPGTLDDLRMRTALENVFSCVIAQMSQWEPDSQLSRYNRAVAGERVAIGPQFAIVLDCALQIARASDGAFDPTLGAASEAWGFGAAPAPSSVPHQGTRQGEPGWHALSWSFGETELLQPGSVALDFSGIAKGFAVDMSVAALERLGVRHALLEIGGELRGIGVREDGLPWWVDLEQPPESNAPLARLGLTGWAVATSGNYRRRRSVGAQSWSHTLDPHTGCPIADAVRSVSVLHRGCMQADALATAITVMGPEHGLAFADRFGIPARIVMADTTITSAAWRRWLS